MSGIIQGIVYSIGIYILGYLAKKYSQHRVVKWLIGVVLTFLVVVAIFVAGEFFGVVKTEKLTGDWRVTDKIVEFWKWGSGKIDDLVDPFKPGSVTPTPVELDPLDQARVDEIDATKAELEQVRKNAEEMKERCEEDKRLAERVVEPLKQKLAVFVSYLENDEDAVYDGVKYSVRDMKTQKPELESRISELNVRIEKDVKRIKKLEDTLKQKRDDIEMLEDVRFDIVSASLDKAFDIDGFIEQVKQARGGVRDIEELYRRRDDVSETEVESDGAENKTATSPIITEKDDAFIEAASQKIFKSVEKVRPGKSEQNQEEKTPEQSETGGGLNPGDLAI